MKKVIYLFWFTKKDHFNFGDDINPFIIESLSNKKVKRVMVFSKKKSIIFNFLKIIRGFFLGFYDNSVFIEYIRSLTHPDYVVCIGSILQNSFSKKAKIWGAGIIHKESFIQKSEFHAVRGLKTVERIKGLGYNFTGKIGDPALLLPLIYNPKIQESDTIGIIPHITHFEATKSIFNNPEKYTLIDLSENDIEKTINAIKSCKYILSSSLHGLIVPHAYNIPALHMQLEGSLAGDGVKFLDYYSSVAIEEYKPISIPDSNTLNSDYFKDLFNQHNKNALPKKEIINQVQKDLLSVAPFELADKYKSYITD
nr:polysaccharide pyruvyl transferase family protein [uncultured Brumimicrobium sp.]